MPDQGGSDSSKDKKPKNPSEKLNYKGKESNIYFNMI